MEIAHVVPMRARPRDRANPYNAGMITRGAMFLILCLACTGCNSPNFDPAYATRPYPFQLHTTDTVAIQVFRDGAHLEIVNSTDRNWGESTIWINQQFAHDVDGLAPGQRLTFDLFEFRNDIGERFNAGGWFRTRQPTPVRLVELQPGEGQPLIGFVAIRNLDEE